MSRVYKYAASSALIIESLSKHSHRPPQPSRSLPAFKYTRASAQEQSSLTHRSQVNSEQANMSNKETANNLGGLTDQDAKSEEKVEEDQQVLAEATKKAFWESFLKEGKTEEEITRYWETSENALDVASQQEDDQQEVAAAETKTDIEGSISALQLTLYQKINWQTRQTKCEQQLLHCDDPQKRKQLEQELEICKRNVADPFPGGSKLLATIQKEDTFPLNILVLGFPKHLVVDKCSPKTTLKTLYKKVLKGLAHEDYQGEFGSGEGMQLWKSSVIEPYSWVHMDHDKKPKKPLSEYNVTSAEDAAQTKFVVTHDEGLPASDDKRWPLSYVMQSEQLAAKDDATKVDMCTCPIPKDMLPSDDKSEMENMKAIIKGLVHHMGIMYASRDLHAKAFQESHKTCQALADSLNHFKNELVDLQCYVYTQLGPMVELMTRQPSSLVSICIRIAFNYEIPTDSKRFGDSGVKTRSQMCLAGKEFCCTVSLFAKASVLLHHVEGQTGVEKDVLVLYKKDEVTVIDPETPVHECGGTVVAKLGGGLAGGAKANPNKPNPKKVKKDKKQKHRAGTFALFTQGTPGDVQNALSVYEGTDRQLGMRMFDAIYKGGEENELNIYFNQGDAYQQNRIVELQLSVVNEIFGGSRYALSEEEIQTNYLRFFEIDEET